MIQAVKERDVNRPQAGRPTVCHVIHALGVGGAEVLVDTLVRRLNEQFRAVVAVLDHVGEIGDQLRADGFVVEHLHRRPGIDRGCARRLHQFAMREGAELFHAHQYTPFFQAMLSRGLLGRRPIVFTEHGRHFPDLPSRRRSIVNRLLLGRHDRLVGVGGAVRQALIDNEGLPAGRVQVIYNGVDVDRLAAAAPEARHRIRAEFRIGPDDFLTVQVARLHKLKDHATALRCMNELRITVPGARLLIVGDGEERAALEQMIDDLSLHRHVILAGSRSDIADLLAAADVFLMTSISEGIPLTIIEAMAAGLPVVSTAVGGIPEMIEHERNGLLAAPQDYRTLSRLLARLQQQPSLRYRFAKAGRETARRRFSLQGMLDQYAQLYREVLHVC